MRPPPRDLDGRGGVAGRWSVQDGPRWLQEGLRERKMASTMAQHSRTWHNIASERPPRGPIEGHNTVPGALRTPQGRLQDAQTFQTRE